MKCSECSRRNSDTNSFCIYCGTALTAPVRQATNQPGKKLKVVLPPQDIDELISDRYQVATYQPNNRHRGVHPVAVISLAIVLGLGGVYYWWFYRDAVNILAIDYQTTQLINE